MRQPRDLQTRLEHGMMLADDESALAPIDERFQRFTEAPMSKRVLLAGIFHETHTFLDETTPLSSFTVRRGDEILAAAGDASPPHDMG